MQQYLYPGRQQNVVISIENGVVLQRAAAKIEGEAVSHLNGQSGWPLAVFTYSLFSL